MNKKEYKEILGYLYLDPVYIKEIDEKDVESKASCVICFMFNMLEKYYKKAGLWHALEGCYGCFGCKSEVIHQGANYLGDENELNIWKRISKIL